MPSDVSDEALRRMADEWALDSCTIGSVVTLLARIRDMTAARCVEVARNEVQAWKNLGCQKREGAAEVLLESLLALFPGAAAAEGEARDGK